MSKEPSYMLALIYSQDNDAYHLDGVPVFAGERILRSLLKTFLAFRKAFVPVLKPVNKELLETADELANTKTYFPTAIITGL